MIPPRTEPEDPARAALHRAAAALAVAQPRARPGEMSEALADLARACRATRNLVSAEVYFEQALRWARCAGATDPAVELLCELCEVAAGLAEIGTEASSSCGRRRAARERAREHALEASALAGGVADSRWEVAVLLRISDVLDRVGDRDDAMQLQTRALRLMSGQVQPASPVDPALLPGLGRLADG